MTANESGAPAPRGESSTAKVTVSRRRFLGGAGLAGAGVVVGGAAGFGIAEATRGDSPGDGQVPFHGARQAGITTPAQQRLVFGSFDVKTTDVEKLKVTLALWSAAASLMTQGKSVGPTETAPANPPVDTGEAVGLGPQDLTITVGFGPSLFDDRFGLAGKRPAALTPLPALPGDAVLDPSISDGDICVQACSQDPQVAFHVVRNFARIGRGAVALRWLQEGFGRASSTSADQQTPRNLFGFKDGTNNIKADADAERWVWVDDASDQPWMRGGSYLVSRKIRMSIETWDSDNLGDQERVFGRMKESGAPIGARGEFDALDFGAKGPDGKPLIDLNAHVRLAHPDNNDGAQILRRSYNYTNGIDPRTGQLDAGLFFIAFQRDPHDQFVRLQTRLGHQDNLNEYIKHESSALFACPPGVQKVGDYWGKALFA